ncbi:MAG: DNA-binding transcriptional regulator [Kiritimatiellae bacterium]|nr:DNA-binding transcriptional regulator [Kiritimatiellia bacterium]
MESVKKIILFLGDADFHRGVLLGVGDFTANHREWAVQKYIPFRTEEDLRVWLTEAHDAQGIIAHVNSREQAAVFRGFAGRVVNISSRDKAFGLPTVTADNFELGRLAAIHLLGRGFRHFAWVGRAFFFSYERLRGFRETLREHGLDCTDLSEVSTIRPQFLQPLIQKLPKPVGIFTEDDEAALQISSACNSGGWRVPDEVAVLGCNNDEPICLLGYPQRSSVDIAARNIGFEAASLLDKLMLGDREPECPILIKPGGVTVRGSTDVHAVGDPQLGKALRYIRENLALEIGVPDLVQAAGISRRVLERRCRERLGHTPLEEIRRARIRRAKELLLQTDLPMSIVAERAGFQSAERMATLFRRETGTTPSRFRQQK